MIAVCRKELRSYRISMIGYVFIAFMLAVVSLYFAYQNLNLASPRFELVLQNVQFIFLVFVPILTAENFTEIASRMETTVLRNSRDRLRGISQHGTTPSAGGTLCDKHPIL